MLVPKRFQRLNNIIIKTPFIMCGTYQPYSTGSTRMRALATQGEGKVSVQEVDIPSLEAQDILVKAKAVSLNPTDWKTAYRVGPGAILGCDFSGVVQNVGSAVTNLKDGDRVAGFKRGGVSGPTRNAGTFAEYIATEASMVWRVPQTLEDEEAAALGGVGPLTALNALFLRLQLPNFYEVAKNGTTVLIWGGSTSVGMYAIQLAKAAGLTAVATASPANHELVKKLGADAVFDYRKIDAPSEIKSKFPKIQYGIDCVSDENTTLAAAQCFGEKNGKLVTLLKTEQKENFPKNVDVELCVLHTMLGKEMSYGGITFLPLPRKGSSWTGGIEKVMPGGLECISQGLAELESGKVSAKKLAYKI